MKYLKKIWSNSKELSDAYIIMGVIGVVITAVYYLQGNMSLNYFLAIFDFLIVEVFPTILIIIYFIAIKNEKGKKYFFKFNKIISFIFILFIIWRVIIAYELYGGIMCSSSFWCYLSRFDFLFPILVYIYWCKVFLTETDDKTNDSKKKINKFIFSFLFILACTLFIIKMFRIGTNNLYYDSLLMVLCYYLFEKLLLVMLIRYIALYQKFKEGKE